MPADGSERRITIPGNNRTCVDVHVAKGPAIDRNAELAELRRQIDVVDTDVTLINKRIDESQSMCSVSLFALRDCKEFVIVI